jgi:hypothetical protein
MSLLLAIDFYAATPSLLASAIASSAVAVFASLGLLALIQSKKAAHWHFTLSMDAVGLGYNTAAATVGI